MSSFQDAMMKYFGFSLPLFMGRGVFNYNLGMLPHRKRCFTVVGEAFMLPHIEDPSDDEVKKYHGLYTEKLVTLFNEYKDQCGYSKIKLNIA